MVTTRCAYLTCELVAIFGRDLAYVVSSAPTSALLVDEKLVILIELLAKAVASKPLDALNFRERDLVTQLAACSTSAFGKQKTLFSSDWACLGLPDYFSGGTLPQKRNGKRALGDLDVQHFGE